MKIEQRKVWGPEWGPQVKQIAFLASSIYIGQAQGKEKTLIKRGGKIGPGASLFFMSFGSACPHASRMYFPLLSKQNWAVTWSCDTGPSEGYNAGPSIASNFCCDDIEERKLQTPPTSMVPFLGLNLADSTSAQALQGGGQHSLSPTQRKLLQWKLMQRKPSTGEVTRSPVCWKLGQWKTNSAESSHSSVSDSRRPLVKVGVLASTARRTYA